MDFRGDLQCLKKAIFRRKFDGKCSAELESMFKDGFNRWLKMVSIDG